jgi:hypothetical protein
VSDPEDAFWAPILWYRGFHDHPRLICVALERGALLLDSAFSEQLDDYEPFFTVKLVPIESASAADQDLVPKQAADLPTIGTIPIVEKMFDATRRKQIRIPRTIGTLTAVPAAMASGERVTARPSWGDLVRVTDEAPSHIPRGFGSVCGMSTVETEASAIELGWPVGTPYVTVELGDGSSYSVPDACLEIVSRDE